MKKIWKSNITGEILFLLGVILLWQILYMIGVDGLGIWKAYAMPSPSGVWNSFTEMIKQGTLLSAIGNSLLRGAIGYILSLMIGGMLSLLLHSLMRAMQMTSLVSYLILIPEGLREI